TVQELRCILQTEISPVLTKYGIWNILSTIFHGRICFLIGFDQIKILIHSLYFRIASQLQDSGLDPERFVIMSRRLFLSVNVLELIDPINMPVLLTKLIPFLISQVFLDIRIIVNIII